jgi:hypothetical protein
MMKQVLTFFLLFFLSFLSSLFSFFSLIYSIAIGYQPSAAVKQAAEEAGEPIPVTFMPRKPHPNCLLIYALSCLVTHSYKEKGVNWRDIFILKFYLINYNYS